MSRNAQKNKIHSENQLLISDTKIEASDDFRNQQQPDQRDQTQKVDLMGMNPLEDQSFEDKEDSDFMSRNDNIEMSRKGLINEPTERDASESKQEQ